MSTLDDLTAADLVPLDGPDGIAERLVILLHRGVDWTVWGGTRRVRYWDALADYTRLATYAGPALADWWARASVRLSSDIPIDSDGRAELAGLLTADPRPVLEALRHHTNMLVLRCRIVSDARRKAWDSAQADRDRARQEPLV